MNNLNGIRITLENEIARLQHQWQATSGAWKDTARDRFEREFWQEYERTPPLVFKEMENLAVMINKARQEVK